jgi:hypothetical protein
VAVFLLYVFLWALERAILTSQAFTWYWRWQFSHFPLSIETEIGWFSTSHFSVALNRTIYSFPTFLCSWKWQFSQLPIHLFYCLRLGSVSCPVLWVSVTPPYMRHAYVIWSCHPPYFSSEVGGRNFYIHSQVCMVSQPRLPLSEHFASVITVIMYLFQLDCSSLIMHITVLVPVVYGSTMWHVSFMCLQQEVHSTSTKASLTVLQMVLQHSCHPSMLFKCVLLLQTSVPFCMGQWMKSFQFHMLSTIFSFWFIASSFHSVCCLPVPNWTIFFWVVVMGFLLLIFSSNVLLYNLGQSIIFTWPNHCNHFSSISIN